VIKALRTRVEGLIDGFNGLFESEVEIPRIRYGKKQTLDTLITEK